MGETLEARIAFLQRQVHAINLAIIQARARNDQLAIERLAAVSVKLREEISALQREAYDKDMPSEFMLALAEVSEQADQVAKALGDTVVTTAKLARYLPWIVLGLIVVVGLVYAGKLSRDLRS